MSWDFNDAEDSTPKYSVIPDKTLVDTEITIMPGGYDDFENGLTGGLATKGNTGSVYVKLKVKVISENYLNRVMFDMIGIHSPKGPEWTNMGRSKVKSIINSHFGLAKKDVSDEAISKRRLKSLADLDGMRAVAKVKVTQDQNGEDKNDVSFYLSADDFGYADFRHTGMSIADTLGGDDLPSKTPF